MMMENELMIPTHHGKVNLLHFPSVNPTDKKILCIHGYCSDARIFRYLGAEMSRREFDIYALDIFGHGKSDGPRGDPNFDKTLQSIDEVIDKIRGHSKLFILGHSLGCTYALWYVLTYSRKKNVDGIILMSPYVRIKGIKDSGEALPTLAQFLKLYFLKLLIPKNRVSAMRVVRNSVLGTTEVQQMLSDPQINYRYSYRYIIDVIAAKNSKATQLSEVDVPVIILHGKNDKNVYYQVSEEFYKILRSRQKVIQLIDCDHWFYHTIFYDQKDARYSEQDRAKVLNAITDSIERVESN